MSIRRSYIGWRLSQTPVLRGPKLSGAFTLADLTNPAHIEDVAVRLAEASDLDGRHARLTVVHYAATALSTALVSPLACDGAVLRLSRDDVGLVLDDSAVLQAVWVGDGEDQHGGEPALVGSDLWGMLASVGDAVRPGAHVGATAMNVVMYEAIELEALRLARLGAPGPGEQWVEAFLAGVPFSPRTPLRSVTVSVDDGPDVTLPVRRVCCVLDRTPSVDACPNCPQFDAQSRAEETRRWLTSLSDADFASVTGRARVVHGPSGVAVRPRRRSTT